MHKTVVFLTFILLFLFATTHSIAQAFDYNRLPAHPRIMLKQGEEQKITASLQVNPELYRVHRIILNSCDSMLIQPTLMYQKEGKRLLAVSREALKRLFYLSYAWRMTHDDRYRLRAEQELVTVCSFPDWNPSHFLDVGEMTLAVSLGYDWLFDRLTPGTKKMVQHAILTKAFEPSDNPRYNWFLRSENNWNQVCNAGMVYGALAVIDEHKEVAIRMIERAMSTIGICAKGYAPDGAYPEGYNYWGYGTSFEVFMIAALESALGSDGGLCSTEGFLGSARYMEYMTGVTNLCFNYSDARETVQALPALYWFAAKLQDPTLLWNEKTYLNREELYFTDEEKRFLPLMLIYGSQLNMNEITPPAANMWVGHGRTPVVLVRTDWQGNEGCYMGLKGGTASTSHAHMDAGSFVFEAMGVRWAQDLGMQEYYSLEKEKVDLWNTSQQGQRWEIFRYNNYVHNTLTVNGKLHQVEGFVPIVRTYTLKNKQGGLLDLTGLFGNELKKATREAVLLNEQYLQVTDRIQGGQTPATVRWTMVTTATPRILDAHTMELAKEGKTLHVILDSPSDATFQVLDNVPGHSYDTPNPGSVRIVFDTKLKAGQSRTLKVRLVPVH